MPAVVILSDPSYQGSAGTVHWGPLLRVSEVCSWGAIWDYSLITVSINEAPFSGCWQNSSISLLLQGQSPHFCMAACSQKLPAIPQGSLATPFHNRAADFRAGRALTLLRQSLMWCMVIAGVTSHPLCYILLLEPSHRPHLLWRGTHSTEA